MAALEWYRFAQMSMPRVRPLVCDRSTPPRRSSWLLFGAAVILVTYFASSCGTAESNDAACSAGVMPLKKLPGCSKCLAERCCSTASRCNANPGCKEIAVCVFECEFGNVDCAFDCERQYTQSGGNDYTPLATCAETMCEPQCGPPGTLVGSTAVGSTVTAGGAGPTTASGVGGSS